MFNLQDSVEEVMEKLHGDNKSYSAFDITRLVRASTTDNVRHYEVRDYINKMYDSRDINDSSYTVTDVQLKNSNYTRVFHEMNVDANLYNEDELDPKNPENCIYIPNGFTTPATSKTDIVDLVSNTPAPINTVAVVGFVAPVVNKIKVNKVKKDSWDRLTVRAGALKAAGFKKGDLIHLWFSVGTNGVKKLVIASKNSDTNLRNGGYLKIDKSGNIRLSSYKLSLAGLDKEVLFNQESHPNSVSITKA